MESIYGKWKDILPKVMDLFVSRMEDYNRKIRETEGEGIYEHLSARIKSEDSMREKCRRKSVPENTESALVTLHDSIGIRAVCGFVDDVYKIIDFIKSMDSVEVVEEKDYIAHAKPNGYRSYHMILLFTVPYEDYQGRNPGRFYVEVQLRTIAMDSWASLEHTMSYKKEIRNRALITQELKRCADELASCDVSMQTIRNLIRESAKDNGSEA